MKTYILTPIMLVFFIQSLFSQWLDEKTLKNVLLIEKKDNNNYLPHGTGFLLWNYNNEDYPILVTCSHLISRNELYFSLNADTSFLKFISKNKVDSVVTDLQTWYIVGKKLRCKINFKNYTIILNKEIDICAFPISLPSIEYKNDTGKILFTVAKPMTFPKSLIKYRKDIKLGDEVYFIGFPFGMGTSNKIEPLVRSGSVAWLSDYYNEFLLDALSYGGNSGSPVYMKTILGANPGVIEWNDPKLIGMIIGHEGLYIENVLNQPNPKELKFEISNVEMNFGLARVVYIDNIMEVVNLASALTKKKKK